MPPTASVTRRQALQKEDSAELLNGFTAMELGLPLKSNLKSPRHRRYTPPICYDDGADAKMDDTSAASELNCHERKSIQWLDSLGKELIEVREFEASDSEDSDDDLSSCACVIQ